MNSELNPIETQWHQLKSHEIAGHMFDNEYDLAIAVMDGMKARSEVGEYDLERFIFNCTYHLPPIKPAAINSIHAYRFRRCIVSCDDR